LPPEIFPKVKGPDPTIHIELEVASGVIQDVRVQLPLNYFDPDLDLSEAMHGLAFGKDVTKAVYDALQLQPMSEAKKDFIYQCVAQMIGKFT
jgi:hypothetical protein